MEYALITAGAFALDFVAGDPRWMPHPVRGLGRMAVLFEIFFRKHLENEKLAGIMTAFFSIAFPVSAVFVILEISGMAGKSVEIIVAIIITYFSIAPRDLYDHAMRVRKALDDSEPDSARRQVSFMVGRDTALMEESEIIRATVESVAENTVDAALSPVFWASVFGPLGAFGYRIINTLDSMFGYKNEKYLDFGWASARLDDIANYIPARIGLVFFAIAAWLSGLNGKNALFTGLRDGQKHSSPNSGISEAAVAGALGIQLGGPVSRNGEVFENPLIGEPFNKTGKEHVQIAGRLMLAVSALFMVVCVLFRVFLKQLI